MLKFNSYGDLINFAKSQVRTKGSFVYYEKHHIIPKHDGGTDDKDNLVLLTLYEHLLAHYLLAIEYENTDKRKYFTNLSACAYIISATDKHFQTLEAKEYLRNILENPDCIELLNLIKNKNQKREPPIKGKCFVMKNGIRKCINQNQLSLYESRGWVKQTIDFKWMQLNNRKPEKFSVRKIDKKIKEGYIIIDKCPICKQPNSAESWCCCKECEDIYEEQRIQNKRNVQAINMKDEWANNDARYKMVKSQNGPIKGERMWVNDGSVSININKDEYETYILKGFNRGRAKSTKYI